MTALLVKPLPFTVNGSNSHATYPASNADLDIPGLVWRSGNLTTVYVTVDLGTGPLSYDTVALVGTNLRASDTVTVYTGNTPSTITTSHAYTTGSKAAFTGSLPDGARSKFIFKFPVARSERYVRFSITATSHPDGFVQAQRIVVGKAVMSEGVESDVEQGWVDQSVSYQGPGYTSFDEYETVPAMKFKMGWIPGDTWRASYHGFFQQVGTNKGILFVTDYEEADRFQTDALFGRITSRAQGKHIASDQWTVELVVQALST